MDEQLDEMGKSAGAALWGFGCTLFVLLVVAVTLTRCVLERLTY